MLSDSARKPTLIVGRKVFSSNLAHLSLVFFWISGMHFHGAYFSNYDIWLKDAKDYLAVLSQLSLIHQDILNSHQSSTTYYFQGIDVLSGIFQLWHVEGILTPNHLKYVASASFLSGIISLGGSYFHMHISSDTNSKYKKFKGLSIHHLSLLFGLTSIALSAHQYHISMPLNPLLQAGISPLQIPCPQDLLFKDLIGEFTSILRSTNNRIGLETYSDFSWKSPHHHFYVGIVFITSSVIGFPYHPRKIESFQELLGSRGLTTPLHGQVATNLSFTGSLSTRLAHVQNAIPIYPFSLSDYPTSLSLFVHHMWVAPYLIIGSGTHSSIFWITDLMGQQALLKHRDLILSHLIWVSFALGLHSFGLYIHNDSLQALRHPQDIFHDNSIQLKPVFGGLLCSPFDIKILDKKLIGDRAELGTADFIVHHIHAFTIHLPLLILSKGILYARNSRLVSDKLELGFRYPCDGPGRGGTCQISSWDHIYLAVFWMYNSLSVVLFHYFWKMQSDVWAFIYNIPSQKIMHISGGDFSVNSSSINGWLRNFLWSQAAQVIQSYGTSISGYGFIFISAHFLWAFSLMFLLSGRGYWQELIESILWAHHKFKIMPHIQPKALSISQGRAVGFIHYTLGGIGCTWAFFISRMLVLSI